MKKSYSIKYVSQPKKILKKSLGRQLDLYNKSKMGFVNWKDLGIEAKDPKGKLVGGLVGGTYWGWLQVYELWVDAAYRDEGLGTTLLREAEALARKRGCRHVHLDTFSFQAPGFYRKLGFKKLGVLKPFPRGNARYYLYKKMG